MGDLSKNINRREVACHCGCGFDTMDAETITVVQECCDHFAETMGVDRCVLLVHSGARCKEHNDYVGGVIGSQHVQGRAMDISIKGIDSVDICNFIDCNYPEMYGVGCYESFAHIDTRSNQLARWP